MAMNRLDLGTRPRALRAELGLSLSQRGGRRPGRLLVVGVAGGGS